MYTAVWNIEVDGAVHEVKLEWTYWGGERDVYVDGVLVDEDKKPLRWKSDQQVDVAGKRVTVLTRPHSALHSARFSVLLQVDGAEIEPDENLSDIGQR